MYVSDEYTDTFFSLFGLLLRDMYYLCVLCCRVIIIAA